MGGVARCGLLRLIEQELFMPGESRANGVALFSGFTEWRDRHHRGGAWSLNYTPVQGNSAIERRRSPHDTVVADHGRFDYVSATEGHDERMIPLWGK
jgi:hypothetical protein